MGPLQSSREGGPATRVSDALEFLLIFPHGSAPLDERLQTLVGVFQSHELVEIDVLSPLEGILKT